MATFRSLRALQVEKLGVGTYADGGNLFLRVRSSASRQWIFRYKLGGRVTEISIGPTRVVSLREARDTAEAMRRAARQGVDPRSVLKRSNSQGLTFRDYAERLIAHRLPSLKPGRHQDKFGNSLRDYVYPFIGRSRPLEIGFADVENILKQAVWDSRQGRLRPFWNCKYETASRVRRRIEAVLDYADRVEGNDRRNPAAWKGGLEHSQLGRRPRVVHRASLPHAAVPNLMSRLRAAKSQSSLCLRFIILTGARSGEARAATWSEVDLENALWTVQANRTKMGVLWRVPLSEEALSILTELRSSVDEAHDYVFAGPTKKPLSDVAVSKALHAFEPHVTVHGFRASFRTWGAEQGQFANEVLERALGHVDANKVRAAYQRSDLLEERRKLAHEWCAYLSPAGSFPS
ncbi:tyrosine-type recombinase/integrase [Sphingomonas telluris]|uniref:tyrosine-type recombinase/integrase n=1 Tax=Sphingomonas telluris TaxID=2907998 RepID=UPI003450224F